MDDVKVYLFDWGDTLMVDIPGKKGKMCDWEEVKAVEGAWLTLSSLSKGSRIYIATGAADSSEIDIKKAFERVGLDEFINGYFCKENIGSIKGEHSFLPRILNRLSIHANDVVMVGNSLNKDIVPALTAGIRPVLLTKESPANLPNGVKTVAKLIDILDL